MQHDGKWGHHLPGRLCEQRAQLLQVTEHGRGLRRRTCPQPGAGPREGSRPGPADGGAGARGARALLERESIHLAFAAVAFPLLPAHVTWLVLRIKARTHVDGAKEPFTLFNKN